MRTSLKKKPIQIYVEPSQDRALESLAKRKGVSKAAVIRLSLNKYLSEIPIEEDPALKIIAIGKSGKGDLSEKHDFYIGKYSGSQKRR